MKKTFELPYKTIVLMMYCRSLTKEKADVFLFLDSLFSFCVHLYYLIDERSFIKRERRTTCMLNTICNCRVVRRQFSSIIFLLHTLLCYNCGKYFCCVFCYFFLYSFSDYISSIFNMCIEKTSIMFIYVESVKFDVSKENESS